MDGELSFVFREICPRDFYWFALVENDFPDIDSSLFVILVIALLLDLPEDHPDIAAIPKRSLSALYWWISKEILEEKLMKVDQWFKLSFHLCKQRFDNTMEWFEEQPMSKILLMTSVMSNYADEQNKEMKKASRRK